jgi:hypothetical protein
MITLDFLNGYWTILVNSKPIVSCASFASAIAVVPEAIIETEIELQVAA